MNGKSLAREGGRLVFRRPNEPVALDDWADKAGAKREAS